MAPHPSVTPARRIALLHLALLLALLAAASAPVTIPRAEAATAPAGDLPPRFSGRSLTRPGDYLSDPAPGDPEAIARAFILRERRRLGLTDDDLSDIVLKDRYTSAHNGLTHLYFRQRLGGVELFNGDININVARDGRILNLGNGFLPDLRGAASAPAVRISPADAVGKAAGQLGLRLSSAVTPLTAAAGPDGGQLLSDGGISYDPIPARLIYMPMAPGDVRLSWELTLRLKNNEDWLSIRVDAGTGQILSSVNYFAHSDAHIDPADHGINGHEAAPPAAALASSVADGSGYRVYAFPKESPYDGERTLVENPANSVGSPFGWHDTDGQPGAEHTITRGNNVHAYQDQDADDVSALDEPDGTGNLDFDQPLDLGQQPDTYVEAATTNLFYANNYIHDVLFFHGFDEAAGNFQQTNYSGDGLGGDYVQAEAQDGGGTVNANFATPPDGELPRMQMYLGNTAAPTLTINSPPTIAGSYAAGTATFGPTTFNLSAEVVLVNDGVVNGQSGASVNDGCEGSFNDVAGKIALIDRGGCSFIIKATNATNADAVGVMIANNVAGGTPPGMGGAGSTVPTISVTQETGAALKNALASGTVDVTMVRTNLRTDGSLDNGVIAHEYGHGLSNRLTGGPSNASCLTSAEQAGEGWSDFLALALTAQPGDTAAQPMAIGNYLFNTGADGAGIRNKLYSTDMTVNGYTYDTLKTITSGRPHDVGEVWATMLWDLYWRLTDSFGFDPNLIGGEGGNLTALQLVIDGLKLQPCNPTFTDARDGILAADVANNDGANQCLIWEVFARRGLGYSADAGLDSSITDGTEAFDLPSLCTLRAEQDILDVCIPSSGNVAVRVGESFAGPVTLSATGLPPGASASFSANPVVARSSSTLTIAAAGASPGGSTVTITGAGPSDTYTYDVELNLADAVPPAPALTSPAGGAADQADTPALTWSPAAQAASYRVQIAAEPTFTDPLYDVTVRTTSFTPDAPLVADTTYFWRVSAANGCGSSPLGAASFSVRNIARILLVDDTVESTGSRALYTAALDALGEPYDVWDGANPDDEPSLAKLRNYNTVLWFGGYDFNGVPSVAAEARLADWLPSNRCLVLSSQELFARRDATVSGFMRDHLGVESMADDSAHTTVAGVASTTFDGVGPLTLTYTGNNYSDHMVPNASGTLVMTGNGAKGAGAAIARDGGSYRTLYLGFPAETMAPADLRATLARSLAWCDEVTSVSDLSLAQTTAPAGPSLLPGQPLTYTLTFRNDGLSSATGVRLALSLPPQLVDVSTTSSGPALSPVQNQPYTWDVANLADEASGTLTLHARVDPALRAAASFAIEATISGGGPEADSADQSVAVSLAARVPSLSFAEGSLSVAEDGGPAQIAVRLSEPNPYAAISVSYALAGGTAASGSDFAFAPGALSFPAGTSEASFGLSPRGDRLAEGPETVVIGLGGPQGATLGTASALTVTIDDAPGGTLLASAEGVAIAEGGPAGSYTLVLDRAPAANVTVALSVGGQASLGAATLTFTPANWNVPQPVTVTALDDAVVEGAHNATISHSVASADGRFDGASLAGVTVSITDNDSGEEPPPSGYMTYLPALSR